MDMASSSEFAPQRFNVFRPDGSMHRDGGLCEFTAARAASVAARIGGEVEPASGTAAAVDQAIRQLAESKAAK